MRRYPGVVVRGPICLILCAVVAACGTGEITYIAPTPPANAAVTIQLVPDPEDASLAATLGWGSAIQGATASIIPADSSVPPLVFQSSSSGEIQVPSLTAGAYLVRIQRLLSGAEMAQLPVAEGVEGWATLGTIRVSATLTSFTLRVQASRRRSLMISEWFFNDPQDPIIGSYSYAQYIELYNNADTTLYLDGMRLGQGYRGSYDYPNFPCAAYTEILNDPTSVWAIDVQQFPGTGHDYPVAPGQVVLVAVDGIDHRGIARGGPDLRNADFEMEATLDADNPAVPNMKSVGPRFQTYHGILLNALMNVVFLSAPVTAADLRYSPVFGIAYQYERYPVSKLLDVATWWTNWTGSLYPACPRVANAALDRDPARGFGSDNYEFETERSLHRVQLRPGSRPRFQHTRNSAADYIIKLRSPGTISPPP